MSNLMEVIEPMARKLEVLDEQVSRLKHELEDLVSQREELSNQIVATLQEQGIDTSLGLAGGGTVKLDVQTYPSIKDYEKLGAWASSAGVELPAATINSKTLQGWYREQRDTGGQLPPEDVVSVFIKTKAKVLKK